MGPSFLISTGLFRNFLFSHTKISFFHCAIQLPASERREKRREKREERREKREERREKREERS